MRFIINWTTILSGAFITITKANTAYDGIVTEIQSDGSSIDLHVNGDEHDSFETTVDGYTVIWKEDKRRGLKGLKKTKPWATEGGGSSRGICYIAHRDGKGRLRATGIR